MFNTATEIVLFIGGIFVIIGGLYKAYLLLNKRWVSSRNKKDHFFSGCWSNEGLIGEKSPSHYIDLTLSCSGKKVNGSFNVRKSGENHTWHNVSITGKRNSYTLKCTVIHIGHGQILDYGTVLLKKDPKRNLVWILKKGIVDFFPNEATLYRSLPVLA